MALRHLYSYSCLPPTLVSYLVIHGLIPRLVPTIRYTNRVYLISKPNPTLYYHGRGDDQSLSSCPPKLNYDIRVTTWALCCRTNTSRTVGIRTEKHDSCSKHDQFCTELDPIDRATSRNSCQDDLNYFQNSDRMVFVVARSDEKADRPPCSPIQCTA